MRFDWTLGPTKIYRSRSLLLLRGIETDTATIGCSFRSGKGSVLGQPGWKGEKISFQPASHRFQPTPGWKNGGFWEGPGATYRVQSPKTMFWHG